MVDILHRIGVKAASPYDVYEALTTTKGLTGWWTEETKGSGDLGGLLQFRFEPGGFDMEVVEAQPGERVVWHVTDGPEEWVDTQVTWDLKQDGDYTIVLFRHAGWREPVEFMHHCSTKWGAFLQSLKALLETGEGAPSPRDVEIDNWN